MTTARSLTLASLPLAALALALTLTGCASDEKASAGTDPLADVQESLGCSSFVANEEALPGTDAGGVCVIDGMRPVNVYHLASDDDADFDAFVEAAGGQGDPGDWSIRVDGDVVVVPQDTTQLDDVAALVG